MPRISTNTHIFDFCKYCFPNRHLAKIIYGNNIEYETQHPNYSDPYADHETSYKCASCGAELDKRDN